MARVVKERAVRRGELLDKAQELFFLHGYEGTSVAQIIGAVGVSKGAFYHHFRSKADLLDSLVARIAEQILVQVREAVRDERLDAIGKLNAFFSASARWKASNMELVLAVTQGLYAEENLHLRHRMERAHMALFGEELAAIIAEGVSQGVFDTPHPKEAAEAIFHVANGLGESMARLLLECARRPENATVIRRTVEVLRDAIERILGAPKRSVRLIDEKDLQAFLPRRGGHRSTKRDRTGGLRRDPA